MVFRLAAALCASACHLPTTNVLPLILAGFTSLVLSGSVPFLTFPIRERIWVKASPVRFSNTLPLPEAT
jgi:hypothetical protein